MKFIAKLATHFGCFTVIACCATGCDRRGESPTPPSESAANTQPPDPYDIANMDLAPKPAKISAVRHEGAFAEGASLSFGPELKPLDTAPIKSVRLDTTHKI